MLAASRDSLSDCMKFGFSHFQFDCERQILTRDGEGGTEIVPLNEKPAQLLTLFLRNADTIHSKADILDAVWSNRVVSDQVVFQNISLLRSMFGSDAIKTFTKKGYQWQLPLTQVEQDVADVAPVDGRQVDEQQVDQLPADGPVAARVVSSQMSAQAGERRVRPRVLYGPMLYGLLCSLLLMVAGLAYFALPVSDQQRLAEHKKLLVLSSPETVPAMNLTPDAMTIEIREDNRARQALFDSPYRTWQAVAGRPDTWLLATKRYVAEQEAVLRFQLQGVHRGWHGYIVASDDRSANRELRELLALLEDSDYFTVASDQAALAQLTLLQNTHPQNPLISRQMVKLYFELGYLDRATALAETQLTQADRSLEQGLLHLLKVRSNTNNNNWQAGRDSVEQAYRIFSELQLPHLVARTQIQMAWVSYYYQDHRRSMQLLNQSASNGRSANEPLQEVQAHLLQSFLASKVGLNELMHTQLDLARQLIRMHQLDDEHLIPVTYNLAWSAPTLEAALPHYLALLQSPFSRLYQGEFYTAADKVRKAYIKTRQWQHALDSIKPWQRASYAALTRAHVAFAREDWTAGIEAGRQAFRQARVDFSRRDALDAALLLLQNAELPNAAEYVGYIRQNASQRWLSQNRRSLVELAALKDIGGI